MSQVASEACDQTTFIADTFQGRISMAFSRLFCQPIRFELGSPPSTMECFDLQALPFDILILVFQFLDSRSLLNACLTSKGLREIATPLLYEDVQLGPSHRCERYDLLSNIV